MRAGYLGPAGTYTHEAFNGWPGSEQLEAVALPTVYDTIMAVQEGVVDRALVPMENALEGAVNATLDALAVETADVAIVGETVHPVRNCLIARAKIELRAIHTVASHPQANAQCARFLRAQLPEATIVAANSTADAVRLLASQDEGWAALGNRLAAELYGCEVLLADVDDAPDNETRFVWLARGDQADADQTGGAWKTSLVFWGVGADAPGWLVRCLSEFATRDVNLTKIESRPLKQGLGSYMFFTDLEGRDDDPAVASAIDALSGHVDTLRVLGSYPAAG